MAATGNTEPNIDTASLRPRGLALGEMVPDSRYRIVAQIGKGGMGVVYEAEHVDLKKRVAIKILMAKTASDTKKVAAFLREAQTASSINSQYIADVTDFGQLPDGRVYFVMQFVEGESLGRLLRQGEVFTADRVIGILRQIAKALAETHSKGVAHLDVKPDNVMLLHDGKRGDSVKMVDFGIAGLLAEAAAGAKSISGTPEYVSPERIQAQPYDQRSDVYSLGIVAYELLAGVPPFHGDSAVATLKQHIELEPPPLAERAPGRMVPAALEKVLRQMMARNPDDRPRDMATAEALICEAQIHAGMTTAWDDLALPDVDEDWRSALAARMPTPGARRRRMVTRLAGGLAVLGGTLALYFGVLRPPEIVIKEVLIEGKTVSEAAEVAAWVVRAQQALRRQYYVLPMGESALDYVERAEGEAKELGTASPGAQMLRESTASALLAMGAEMELVDLQDLALVKYREALRFLPTDQQIRMRSQLNPDEEKVFGDRGAWEKREDAGDPSGRAPRARRLAADLFLAARKGRDSEARILQRQLEEMDPQGIQSAALADGLRKLATKTWGDGKVEQARSVYKVIAKLDPEDAKSAVRASDPEVAATIAVKAPEPDPEPAATVPARSVPAPPAAQKRVMAPHVEAIKRDPEEADRLVAEGQRLTRSVKLTDAAKVFEQALAADVRNPAAYAGLAEVHFEQAHYEEALSYSRRAVGLAPRSVPYKLMLGDCYYKLYRYNEARDTWQTAQRLAPANTEIVRRLGDVANKLR